MRPYTVCFMMSSLDGRIDCAMTEKINGSSEYYEILNSYAFDACISGKITASMHYAKEIRPYLGRKVRGSSFFKAGKGKYTVICDDYGTLAWKENTIDGTHLIVALSENVTEEYLEYLKDLNISYVVNGKKSVDLEALMEILYTEFGVKKAGVAGGGIINGAFLKDGLLDEIGMLIGPGIDGRNGMRASFDGITNDGNPYQLSLKGISQYKDDSVFLRYLVRKE